MLSSMNSLNCLESLDQLPVGSLNSICERVRLALLHVFLPRLCEGCRPAFSASFQKTQSTPLLLKTLCDTCKINYIKDKRSVSRKKAASNISGSSSSESISSKSETSRTSTATPSTKIIGAKKVSVSNSLAVTSNTTHTTNITTANNNISDNNNNNNFTSVDNVSYKIKRIKLVDSQPNPQPQGNECEFKLPMTPPPSDDFIEEILEKDKVNKTSLISNETVNNVVIVKSRDLSLLPKLDTSRQIYKSLSEKGVDWCRYCGVAGDTGTFWKLGPWGDRSLCHKHGCEFFGCGFARVTKNRLDLTKYYGEKREDRNRPIISEFCSICWNAKKCKEEEVVGVGVGVGVSVLESVEIDNNHEHKHEPLDLEHEHEHELEADELIQCHGCPLSYHKSCLKSQTNFIFPFYCSLNCENNFYECLIRPQFSSKARFPHYRSIATFDTLPTLPPRPPTITTTDNNNKLTLKLNFSNNVKIKEASTITRHGSKNLNFIKANQSSSSNSNLQKRKYRKHDHDTKGSNDRIIAFVPVKVDSSVHIHENIHTPQWTEMSISERFTLNSTCTDKNGEEEFEEEEEVLDDVLLLARHARYEQVERTTRLLKPGVLKKLISGEDVN